MVSKKVKLGHFYTMLISIIMVVSSAFKIVHCEISRNITFNIVSEE